MDAITERYEEILGDALPIVCECCAEKDGLYNVNGETLCLDCLWDMVVDEAVEQETRLLVTYNKDN